MFRWLIVLVLPLSSLAFAQGVVQKHSTLSPDVIAYIVAVIAAFGAHWLTALTKGRLGTEGRATQLLAGFFSALIAGWGAYGAGLYGHGWQAALVAVLASLLTWAFSIGLFLSKQKPSGAADVKTVDTALPSSEPPAEPVTPAAADQTPALLPAPVEAAPVLPGDPAMYNLMTLLTAALASGSTPPTTSTLPALAAWVDTWGPKFKADILALGTGITPAAVFGLITDAIPAGNALTGTLAGLDRAEVVAVTLRFAVQEFAPAAALPFLTPILASGVLENMIEAEYRRLFPVAPTVVVIAPVTDAPELPSGESVR